MGVRRLVTFLVVTTAIAAIMAIMFGSIQTIMDRAVANLFN